MRYNTEKVLKFIKENIGKISYDKMGEKLGIPKSTIGWLVYRHKIKNDKSLIKECKKFTKKEKDYMKKNKEKSFYAISLALSCSVERVKRYMLEENLKEEIIEQEKEYSDYVKNERYKLEHKFKEFLEKIGENRVLKLKNGCDMKYLEQFETAQFINIIPTETDAVIKIEILEAI